MFSSKTIGHFFQRHDQISFGCCFSDFDIDESTVSFYFSPKFRFVFSFSSSLLFFIYFTLHDNVQSESYLYNCP